MIYGWRESSKCTTSANQFENSNEKFSTQNLNEDTIYNTNVEINAQQTSNLLELNCENNLIFIASSHFGQRNNVNRIGSSSKPKNNLFHLDKNSTLDINE